MNYTTNYHLPQWVKEDRIMMDDFNAAMANLETGMSGNAQAAAKAQSKADAAHQIASSAYSPNQKPYVVGSYTGGGKDLTVTLGFRPSFLIISGTKSASGGGATTLAYYIVVTGGHAASDLVSFHDTGFSLHYLVNYSPKLLDSGRQYDYIAFR